MQKIVDLQKKNFVCFSELKRRLKAEKKAKEKAEKEKVEQLAKNAAANETVEKKAAESEEALTEAVSILFYIFILK